MTLVYIQALRFIAAIAVVLFHSLGTGSSYIHTEASPLFQILSFGDRGVDLFFVISGFVISISTAQANSSAADFLLRRIHRIVPPYWAITLFMVLLGLFAPSVFKGARPFTDMQVVESLLFVSFADARFPVVYVGWSLEYEMFFYLAVTVLLMMGRRWVWNEVVIFFCLLAGLGALGRYFGMPHSKVVDFMTNSLVLEFAFGVVAARVFQSLKVPLGVLVSLAGVIGVLIVTDPTNRAVTAGVPASLLVWGAARLSPPRSEWSAPMRIMKRLGDASYSIYLVQILTISAVDKAVAVALPHLPLDVLILVTTLATIVSGYLCYALVERPLLAVTRNWMESSVIHKPREEPPGPPARESVNLSK